MKFINVLKYKIKKLEDQPAIELTAHDLAKSEILWVKEAQRALTSLTRGPSNLNCSSMKMEPTDAGVG